MVPHFVATICYYDGELVIDEQMCGKYVGGSYKPAKVRIGSNFEQLKQSVYKATKIKSSEFDIDLVCNWPTDSGSKAIRIVDDDDVELMFSAVSKSIELYVGKTRRLVVEQPTPEVAVNYGVGDYSRMLGSVNVSPEIPSPSYSNPPMNVLQYGQQQMFFGYPLVPNYQQNVQFRYPVPTNDSFAHVSRSYTPEQRPTQLSVGPSTSRMSCPLQPTPSELYQMSQNFPVEDNLEMVEDVDLDLNVPDARTLDSMTVVTRPDNDRTWIDNMQVNNDPLNYDFGGAEDGNADDGEEEMEIPLDDDLCNAQLLARSVVANMQFSNEVFSSSSVQNGFKVGMIFESKTKLVQQLSEWSILHAVSFKPIRSNKEKYTAICNVDPSCPWRLHAIDSKKTDAGLWVITKFAGDHTCVNPIVNSNHKQATSTFLVSKVMPFVKENLSITAGTVQVLMEEQLFIKIGYMKAWRALSKAIERIYGDWAESYSTLRQYFSEICRTNPGSVGHVTTDDYGVFDRAFWAFGPSIEGFVHCRPLLCIDGTSAK